MNRKWSKIFTILLITIIGVNISYAKNPDIEKRYVLNSTKPHKMKILNSGIASFKERLDMIDRATKSIEMEYFIFNTDQSAKILVNKLLEKVNNSDVTVRLLIDTSKPIFKFKDVYARLLREKSNDKIQVKYYNRVSLLQIISTQFRNHRKIFIVDDREAIIGGRNIGDEYFDNDPEYNFLDREVWFEGEIVKGIRKTFDDFWTHKIVEDPKPGEKPKESDYTYGTNIGDNVRATQDRNAYRTALYRYNNVIKKAEKFFNFTKEDEEKLKSFNTIGETLLKNEPTGVCNDITFASDTAGKGDNTRYLEIGLKKAIKTVNKNIFIDSPYFILSIKQRSTVHKLLEKGVDISVLTNSLASTDAVYVAAVFNTFAHAWAKRGVDFHIFKGNALPEQEFLTEEIKNESDWGTHSKSAVYDDDNFIVGTYNIDPRSKNINAETMIICRNSKDLAQATLSSIKRRIKYPTSVLLDEEGMPVDGSRRLAGAGIKKFFLYFFSLIPANFLRFLL